MTSFIRTEPCASCEDMRLLDASTGYYGCRRYEGGIPQCGTYREARLIDEELAPQIAAIISRIHNDEKRRELAMGASMGFVEMVEVPCAVSDDPAPRGVPAEFDEVSFIAACGVHIYSEAVA